MLKRRNNTTVTIVLGLGILLAGAAALSWMRRDRDNLALIDPVPSDRSEIAEILSLPEDRRASELEALATDSQADDRPRARYLMALEALDRQEPEAALQWLDGLEKDYPAIGGYILLGRARSYREMGEADRSTETLERLLASYPDRPAAAEALYILSQSDPQYATQAIEQFPTHPRTAEIARSQLEPGDDPDNLPLLLLLSKHLYLSDIIDILDRLTLNYSAQLTPEDWETIAFGYWEKLAYGKAGKAYANAPRTARNLYRTGRGLQLDRQQDRARTAYQQLIEEFPESDEAGLGLLRLARISRDERAMPYLDKLLQEHPDYAAAALIEKSKRLENLNSTKSASQARQSVLTQYSDSEEAAELRWQTARGLAKAGQLAEAWQWGEQVVKENPTSESAPEAAFWVGKWAQDLGETRKAEEAFEYLVATYPESYYAWRAANFLGWNVGDFTTVRQFSPEVAPLTETVLPLAGSETLSELSRLGLQQEAWEQWQVEFLNPMEPTVAEQFTDGLLRMGVGDYIDGIFMLTHLAQREDPEEQVQYQALRQQAAYWQTLYPFPYFDLVLAWSEERQIDPLLTIAIIRQESRFQPAIRSVADAVGLMQVLPSTGDWIAEQYKEPEPTSLTDPAENIRVGTLYLDYTHKLYDNNSLLAVASYNAGPGNVDDWKTRFSLADFDEFAVQIPFPETNDYITSVFGNYWNYLRLYNPQVKAQIEELQRKYSQ
ncbi:MAG: transglycosylase SLT domain-containing protein [Cyanobacteriota bacterium]|nr:transglycosylase SLT domain-containing protein [Cyanobacteriota bacterium]